MIVEFEGEEIALQESLELCDSEGLTHWDSDARKIYVGLSEQTYGLLLDGHVRAKYTVAHELGHAILHTEQLIRLASLSRKSQAALHRDNRGDHPAYLDTEWQANAFAGSLLMPADGIRSLIEDGIAIAAARIARQYKVSTQAAHYRLMSYDKV
jgi:predicted metalloprotease